MDKIVINKHDKERLLLTEVLPYETPIIFSNYGLYKFLKRKDNKPKLIEAIIRNKSPETKPFNFNISKGNSDYRKLSIPHPSSQIEISSLIFDNADLLTSLCSRSNFSIRKPSSVASYYFEKSLFLNSNKDNEIQDMDVEEVNSDQEYGVSTATDTENNFGSSFFSYSGYTLIYKFYRSLQFQSIEKKYQHFLKFDIAKCFNSIYTHSISWAIKSKSFSKENRALNSFDGEFDRVIRRANEGETNGIIVGPEFSRVFAEIILQRIDSLLENRLNDMGILHKVDYEVKRYVDDFFLFTHTEVNRDIIYKEFKSILSDYKLYVNESKEVREVRPFISNLTMAKNEVATTLNEFFKSIHRDNNKAKDKELSKTFNLMSKYLSKFALSEGSQEVDELIKSFQIDKERIKNNIRDTPSIQYIYKPYTRSNNLITKFKGIVKSNKATYEGFSGIVFSIFRARVTLILDEIKDIKNIEEHSGTYKSFIIFTLDFLSFIYAMNTRVRTSFLFSQIIILVKDIYNNLNVPDKIEIEKKIKDETRMLIKQLVMDDKPSIEFINVIISIRTLFGNGVVSDQAICDLLGVSKTCDSLNYFELNCLLFLCCKDNANPDICSKVYNSFLEKVKTEINPAENTEVTLLFFDLLSFPHADRAICEDVITNFYFKTNGRKPSVSEIGAIFNYIANNRWNIDWRGKLNIKKVLQRKEMQVGYH